MATIACTIHQMPNGTRVLLHAFRLYLDRCLLEEAEGIGNKYRSTSYLVTVSSTSRLRCQGSGRGKTLVGEISELARFCVVITALHARTVSRRGHCPFFDLVRRDGGDGVLLFGHDLDLFPFLSTLGG